MTNAMETLYMKWVENHNDSPQMTNVFDKLCRENDITEKNKKHDMLAEIVSEESRNAFSAGFRTAVQLLMGGVQ